MLAVVETHPIQYHVPVYRTLQRVHGIPVTAIYGSDFSLHRYHDLEFGASLAWDVDLVGGYSQEFLSRVSNGGVSDPTRLSAAGLSAALGRLRPRATLVTGYSPSFHRRAWLTAWRFGSPVLFKGEASDLPQTRRPLVRAGRDLGLRLAYRTCARVLYIGQRARRHYRALGVDDAKLVFSPYCVDTTPFATAESDRAELRARARTQLGIDEHAFVLAFSGKLSHRKGVDLLPAAVRELPEAMRRQVVLVCIGDGAARRELEMDAVREPRVDLRVLGVQPQTALSQWYHMADLLVLPSRQNETWGLVVNEALHHGLPCVVSERVGCAIDLVDDSTGAICAAGSSASLTEAIVRAHVLVRRADIRDTCRAKVARYSVDRAADGLAQAYRSATGERGVV